MPTVEKRSISLPPELAAVIDRAVEGGEFGNASEVVREALREWKARRELHGYTVEELRQIRDEGLTSGEAKPLSASFSSSTKERGRAQLSGDGQR